MNYSKIEIAMRKICNVNKSKPYKIIMMMSYEGVEGSHSVFFQMQSTKSLFQVKI